ncbi:MAG: protease pro-enzyme activation domain-containing protein [Thermoplasmata archaeon]
MKRGVKFLVISLAFVFLVAFVFLASSFVTITQENNLVSITNGFDNRLLTGQQIGVPNLNTKIDISIALKINNEQQLDTFLSQVENINSPMFHKFLTKEQFVQLYSPTNYGFNVVYTYFKSQWSDITVGPYNLAIFLNNVPLWKAEQMFHVKFVLFKSNNPDFKEYYFAPTSPVQLPFNVAQYIEGINGLTNAYNYHINVVVLKNLGSDFINSNGLQVIGGADLQKAYQVVQLYNGSFTASS